VTVSVVIPVRDGARFVGAAIQSALSQTVAPGEVIVVDDGSTDTSAEIARGLGVTVVSRPALGAAAARNHGAARASGDHLAFLDADDVWPPDRLELLLAGIGDAEIVFGSEQRFRDPDGELDPPARALMATTALIARPAWDRLGGFDEQWEMGEFMDWLLRARESGLRETSIDATVLHRRIHGANQTANKGLGVYAHVLKASLDRRRNPS
jgi:glycosyltransferase involved in cell wall biosynthesis